MPNFVPQKVTLICGLPKIVPMTMRNRGLRKLSFVSYLFIFVTRMGNGIMPLSLTANGLFEKVTRVQRISHNDEYLEGVTDEEDAQADDTLLPKTGRDMGLLTL